MVTACLNLLVYITDDISYSLLKFIPTLMFVSYSGSNSSDDKREGRRYVGLPQ